MGTFRARPPVAVRVPDGASLPIRYGPTRSERLTVLDRTTDAALDDVVAMVAERFWGTNAELTLMSADRVWLKAANTDTACSRALEDTFCAQVAADRHPLVVPDALADPRFAHHPRVKPSGGLRFYAGVPLSTPTGTVFGALCAWDSQPRAPSDGDLEALAQYGHYASALIELRHVARRLDRDGAVASARAATQELIFSGADLREVLDSVAVAVETAFDGTRCSLLLLDGEKLRDGAGPSLPDDFREAFDGVTIGPHVGSCGTAAFTGKTVVVADIASDPRWDDYRHVALRHGLRACWSVPILGQGGDVLGTFAVYATEARGPSDDEKRRLTAWVHVAKFAISRARHMERLRQAATLDPLTGLVNKIEVLARLHSIAGAPGQATPIAVLFVDLDQFKVVNDTFGHAVADEFLKVVAQRLAGAAGPRDTVARFGGDEFVLLCPSVRLLADAESLARRIVDVLRDPISIDGRTLSLSASVGVAFESAPTADHRADLIGNADLAMYAAKRAGRNSVAVFDPELRIHAAQRLGLEGDLTLALGAGELDCVFQPLVDLRTGRLVDVEVLLRWNSPTRGSVPPMAFIPVAEESGLIGAVGDFVLQRACRQLATWRASGGAWQDVTMWVNVSPRQLRDEDLPGRIESILGQTSLPAGSLGLEITEGMLVEDPQAARSILLKLRESGVKVAIDDFGTGYSSLAQLRHLPVDVLKIDRQFVSDLDADSATDEVVSEGIVEAIVTLARTMKLQVVAEGVETPAQRARLLELNCRVGQGYLWSPPRSADEMTALVDSLPRDSCGRPRFSHHGDVESTG